jgi:hypothetical protein
VLACRSMELLSALICRPDQVSNVFRGTTIVGGSILVVIKSTGVGVGSIVKLVRSFLAARVRSHSFRPRAPPPDRPLPMGNRSASTALFMDSRLSIISHQLRRRLPDGKSILKCSSCGTAYCAGTFSLQRPCTASPAPSLHHLIARIPAEWDGITHASKCADNPLSFVSCIASKEPSQKAHYSHRRMFPFIRESRNANISSLNRRRWNSDCCTIDRKLLECSSLEIFMNEPMPRSIRRWRDSRAMNQRNLSFQFCVDLELS